ncbi:hypothetical protein G7Y79_00027g060670 [Physcia stellaris]|nr:hypothetical protein G7Y79_00027g060670 [Physcia stellaris]
MVYAGQRDSHVWHGMDITHRVATMAVRAVNPEYIYSMPSTKPRAKKTVISPKHEDGVVRYQKGYLVYRYTDLEINPRPRAAAFRRLPPPYLSNQDKQHWTHWYQELATLRPELKHPLRATYTARKNLWALWEKSREERRRSGKRDPTRSYDGPLLYVRDGGIFDEDGFEWEFVAQDGKDQHSPSMKPDTR